MAVGTLAREDWSSALLPADRPRERPGSVAPAGPEGRWRWRRASSCWLVVGSAVAGAVGSRRTTPAEADPAAPLHAAGVGAGRPRGLSARHGPGRPRHPEPHHPRGAPLAAGRRHGRRGERARRRDDRARGAGSSGGRVDTVLMTVVDVTLSFPQLLLALAFVAALGPEPGLRSSWYSGSPAGSATRAWSARRSSPSGKRTSSRPRGRWAWARFA